MTRRKTLAEQKLGRALSTTEGIAAYLTDACESGDASAIAEALGEVARIKGMTHIASEAGVSRENLYRSLIRCGDPKFSTVLKVMKALGLKMDIYGA